jgi:hypothetical protein
MACAVIAGIEDLYLGPVKTGASGLPKPEPVASGQHCPTFIAVTDAGIYWTNMTDCDFDVDLGVGGGGGGGSTGGGGTGGQEAACDQGAVMRAPVDGSSQPKALAGGRCNPLDLVVDDTWVYWTERGRRAPASSGSRKGRGDGGGPDKGVFRTDALVGVSGDGAPYTIADDIAWPAGIAMGDEHLFVAAYLGYDCGVLRRLSKTPGAVEVAGVKSLNGPSRVALGEDGFVYWTERGAFSGDCYGEGPSVKRVDKVSFESPATIAMGGHQPFGIALRGSYVYWTNRDIDGWKSGESDGGNVSRKLADGSGEAKVLSRDALHPGDIAVDDTHVYWTDYGRRDDGSRTNCGGALWRAPTDTGAGKAERLVDEGCDGPWGVAVDDTYVYWTVRHADPDGGADGGASGEVWKMRKRPGP